MAVQRRAAATWPTARGALRHIMLQHVHSEDSGFDSVLVVAVFPPAWVKLVMGVKVGVREVCHRHTCALSWAAALGASLGHPLGKTLF